MLNLVPYPVTVYMYLCDCIWLFTLVLNYWHYFIFIPSYILVFTPLTIFKRCIPCNAGIDHITIPTTQWLGFGDNFESNWRGKLPYSKGIHFMLWTYFIFVISLVWFWLWSRACPGWMLLILDRRFVRQLWAWVVSVIVLTLVLVLALGLASIGYFIKVVGLLLYTLINVFEVLLFILLYVQNSSDIGCRTVMVGYWGGLRSWLDLRCLTRLGPDLGRVLT